jgi:two-component system, LytTR family, response regulator
MKFLIIEDERRAASRLSKMISTYNASIEITGRLESVTLAVSWLKENPMPDLIFMDIQLGDGLCFDIFEECNVKAPVIFTTAYDQFAIKAFKFYSIDYLLKPIHFTELKAALDKFHFLKHHLTNVNLYRETGELLKNPVKERFVIKTGTSINTIKAEEICLIASKDKYTYLYKTDQKKYVIDYTLEQLDLLLDQDMFYRISRTFIVHKNSISKIQTYINSRLILTLNIPVEYPEIIVSRERVQDFKKWMEK